MILNHTSLTRCCAWGMAWCFLAGCASATRRAREFDVRLPAPTPATAAVLVEFIEESGGGDCPQPDPDRVLSSKVVPVRNGQVTLQKPAAHDDIAFLGIHYRHQHARWTFFVPGYAALTVYPDGQQYEGDYDPAANGLRCPSIGWRYNEVLAYARTSPSEIWNARLQDPPEYSPMKPGWPPIDHPYPDDARRITFMLPLRTLSTGRAADPDAGTLPFGRRCALPQGLCTSDAYNFAEQFDALSRAISFSEVKAIDPATRAALVDAIRAEQEALDRYGLAVERPDALRAQVQSLIQRLAPSETARASSRRPRVPTPPPHFSFGNHCRSFPAVVASAGS